MADRRTGAGAATSARRRRSRKSLLISAAVAVVVVALIWLEQVELLYVLATLSVAALLVVVAFSDLGRARQLTQPTPGDDAAAAGDAMNVATPARAGRR